jgi:hypothetical protein
MQYALLIYGDEETPEGRSDEERRAWYAEYSALSADLRKEGKLLGGEELQPVATATAVRVRDGDTLVSDGPFAETKEVLGGFNLIEAENMEEAVRMAAEFPWIRTGSVEVRPLEDMDAVRRRVNAAPSHSHA